MKKYNHNGSVIYNGVEYNLLEPAQCVNDVRGGVHGCVYISYFADKDNIEHEVIWQLLPFGIQLLEAGYEPQSDEEEDAIRDCETQQEFSKYIGVPFWKFEKELDYGLDFREENACNWQEYEIFSEE